MMPIRVKTGKYKIPLKIRKHNANLERYAVGLDPLFNRKIDIRRLNDALELVNDNYDTFKTIFTAPDDINVNMEIKQEVAGLLINLFKQEQVKSDPIRIPVREHVPWPRDLTSYIHSNSNEINSAGFDEEEYTKNKGEWNKRNISDFKKLFE